LALEDRIVIEDGITDVSHTLQWMIPGVPGAYLEAWVDPGRDILMIKIRKDTQTEGERAGYVKRGMLIPLSTEIFDRMEQVLPGSEYPQATVVDLAEFLGAAGDFAKVAAEANTAVERLRALTSGLDDKIKRSAAELGMTLRAFSAPEDPPNEPGPPEDGAGDPARE
jgi:hypothetical protein